MAIVVEATNSWAYTNTDVQTPTFTCPAGTNVLVVVVSTYKVGTGVETDDITPDALTYNGDALTEAHANTLTTTSRNRWTGIHYLINPDTGSAYTLSYDPGNLGTTGFSLVSAVALSGCNTADLVGALTTADISATTDIIITNTTETANSVVIGGVSCGLNTDITLTADGDTTQVGYNDWEGQTYYPTMASGYRICGAAGDYDIGWTSSANISGAYATVEFQATTTSSSVSPSASPSLSPSVSVSPSVSPSLSPSVSVSPSRSPSVSPSVSPSASPSLSPSVSVSPSKSPSESPSESVSVSPSLSPSVSESPSLSPSERPSESPSESPSLSPSVSESPSQSPSESPSESVSVSPSLSPSVSESPSLSPSESPSESPSVSPSVSPSLSPSVSESPSVSPSLSPSVSESPSKSPSESPSESVSVSPSLSPSVSESPSLSPSVSKSPSESPSASPSLSPSVSESPSLSPSESPSESPSISPSLSPSVSESPSQSPSESPSESVSVSPSLSPSVSVSPSLSPSVSVSPSLSPSVSESPSESPSVSPSPSVGYKEYTRGDYSVLPADDTNLETNYSVGETTDVESKNDVRVDQTAQAQYAVHQFKDFVGEGTGASLEWEGQSDLSPTVSTIYLQIYNRDSAAWETLDSDNTSAADTDFSLTASVVDLTNYKDASSVICCRVYQESK